MIQLSEFLPPRPEESWKLIRQVGVDNVVGVLNGAEQDQRMFASVGAGGWTADDRDEVPWSEAAIAHNLATYADHGFTLVALEDTAPIDKARLGLDGRDEQIDNVIAQVRAMGRLGIPTLAYNWMGLSSWGRTDIAIADRGGALVTGYDRATAQAGEPLVEPGRVTREQMWAGLEYFLAAIVPVAEEVGVRLAMHPDDPPQPVDRNLPRIMSSVESFRRLLSLQPSESNGITFCQGNFALMPEVIDGATSIPDLIREFGTEGIPFVHFRDVKGNVDRFQETFHDAGQTDMPACMDAYYEIGFEGAMRPDHVPTLAGEGNARPGYETLGRLFAIGYIRGLEHAAYGHPMTRS
ncbi:mannonate dehydratase [Microbacterium sulfonylureivorans]|uniref:mannonate dehydratase n=1 Tax=Microbacterium sulfonylureivorans TaxID=2486854 RepID=UPI000FDB442F|nr:mannonate dehydratase [Microbacterium sulfonylureivorans]